MSERDDWQEWQHRDECLRQQDIMAALKAAEERGVPRDQLIILADESGVGEFYRITTKRT